MSRFLVRFLRSVVYQPDHPKARRDITELIVSTDDPGLALIHAYRTVSGDPTGATVEPFLGSMGSPSVSEPPQDRPIEIDVRHI